MRDGWEIAPLGSFITQSKKKVKVLDGEEYPAIGVMMEGRGFVTRPPFVGGNTTYKQLTPIEPYQLVLRSITAWEAPIQVTTIEHAGFHVSGVFPVVDIDTAKLNPQFLSLLCRYEPFWESMRERTVGSVLRRKTLSAKALMEIPIQLPPLPDQKRIVDLISAIDAYIEALQQQLETAKKSRNAVLHELLSVSSDDWIETTLGNVVSIINGGTPSTKNEDFWGGSIVWITTTELTAFDGKRINTSKRTITDDGLSNGPARLVRAGTTLVGTTATIGTCAIADCELTFNQQISGLVPLGNDLDDRYLFFWIQHIKPILDGLSAGTSFKRISTSVLKSVSIRFPSIAEQKKTAAVISEMDEFIESIQQTLIEAKSLRSGLLSDLLSGRHEIPASYDKVLDVA